MGAQNSGSLFLPLDVNYYDDDPIIEAGERAELLFIRAMGFMKRNMTDGVMTTAQLPRLGLPGHEARAKKLVEVGLWETHPKGYYCPSFLKRNKSKAVITETRRLESEAGIIGNHRKYHIDGKRSPRCDVCTGRLLDPLADPTRVGDRVPDRGGDSTETETRSKTESRTRTETGTSLGEPPSATHRRGSDLTFEAVVHGCGWDLSTISNNERGKANKASAELRGMNATPEEFTDRALNYRLHFPAMVVTPQAVMGNWSLCENPPAHRDLSVVPSRIPVSDRNAETIHRVVEEMTGGAA